MLMIGTQLSQLGRISKYLSSIEREINLEI